MWLVLVPCIVIVDVHEHSGLSVADSGRRLDLHVDSPSLGPSFRVDLRHCQGCHPSVHAVQLKFFSPSAPRANRGQRPTDLITLGQAPYSEMHTSVDSERLHRCVAQVFLERPHRQVEHPHLRRLDCLDREPLRNYVEDQPFCGEGCRLWVDHFHLGNLGSALRQQPVELEPCGSEDCGIEAADQDDARCADFGIDAHVRSLLRHRSSWLRGSRPSLGYGPGPDKPTATRSPWSRSRRAPFQAVILPDSVRLDTIVDNLSSSRTCRSVVDHALRPSRSRPIDRLGIYPSVRRILDRCHGR